ncbi:hypothetical protein [Streptomyces sp. 4N124]|uniref:hypothetical protein n=1 Tax=Streptomyces sp. 4N124 TaxID=3457420 RepID=UPI003FD00D0F
MSGGARYWNEETQRWEDGDGSGTPATPVTPPPARPGFAPEWPPLGPASAGPPSGSPPAPPVSTPDAPSAPPPLPPVGWPAAGEGSAWHGQGAAEGAAGAWSVPEHVGEGAGAVPSGEWPGGATVTSWPAVDPQPAPPAPAGGMSRRLVWSVVVGAAVVGVAVSLVLTLVVGGGDERDAPSAATSPSAEAEAEAGGSQPSDPYASSPEPSFTEETASPSPSVPELPVGYELYEDEEGFRIARPAGWTRSSVDSQYGMAVVNYRSADGERRLQVYQVAEGSPEESFELFLSDETPKAPGFKELDLQTLDDGEFTGSRLEYLADSIRGEPDVGPWHVYDERFVAEDGNIYAIAAYGLDSDGREDELQLLTTALEGFCPPYACEAASID